MCIPASAFGMVAIRHAHAQHRHPPTSARRVSWRPWAALTLAIGAAISPGASQAVESRFDLDDEGWTLVDAKTGIGGAAVVWQAAGHIQTNDVYDWNAFSAPAAFLGDWRGFKGGTLAFELQATRQDPGAALYFSAALRSGPDLLVWFGGLPSATEMTPFSVALAPGAGWELNPTALGAPGTGTVLAPAAFTAYLAQVEGLYIDADWRFGSDDARLDNVVLSAVPEPGAAALFAAGLAGLVAARRRRRG